MNVFAVLLLFLLLIFALMLAATWFFNMYMKAFVGTKHRILEHLSESCSVPQEWARKFEKKLRSAQDDPGRKEELLQASRRYHLRQLQRMIGYMKRTKLVDSEETRTYMLEQLDRVRRQWEGAVKS